MTPPVTALLRRRLRIALARNVEVTDAPAGIVRSVDEPVPMSDGTTLRVNVFRPQGPGPFPVIMSAHPYGKDKLPRKRRGRYRPVPQYRLIRQPGPVRYSALTSWEAPDPAYWVARGYAVVNADLRGFGTSDGVGEVFSDQEAQDYAELIAWAGTRPWSTGRVGLDGVSYLAISQYKVAALNPPHLAAICPWEGLSDLYEDFARPGGVPENGFMVLWSMGIRSAGRSTTDVLTEQRKRPLKDSWWASRVAELEKVRVPALVCASFSDHSLHSRGSFEAFRRIGSEHKWLYTHRAGKWAAYYSAEGYAARERFFDWALKGVENGQESAPAVRMEIRDRGDEVHAVRHQDTVQPRETEWLRLALDAAKGQLATERPGEESSAAFGRRMRASFTWAVPRDLAVVGPMWLHMQLELCGGDDAHLFAGVRKFRDGHEVTFEGTMGFERDMVTKGWLVASHREADRELSMPGMPVHDHSRRIPFAPGEVAPVDISLLPSATLFRAGDVLRLDLQRRWFHPRDPVRGQFPTYYPPGPRGTALVRTGGRHDSHLLVPVISADLL